MKTLIKPLSLILFALTFSFNAFALNLQQAKSAGQVGELQTGYLGAIKQSAEVQSLVKSVNSKRKQLYLKMARKNNLTLAQIEKAAAEKAIKKTKAGNYYQNTSGQWVKK